uniref:EGF-like domain-containing protein n=1 Tax=Callorhinchus milii TaxID=7868 RepID=A0A4W3HIP1_CALMI
EVLSHGSKHWPISVATSAQETFGDCLEFYTDFCLHGSCKLLISEHLASCTCSRGFVGSRCQYFDLLAVVSEDPNTQKIVVFAMIPVLVIKNFFCCCSLCKCKKWSPKMTDCCCSGMNI